MPHATVDPQLLAQIGEHEARLDGHDTRFASAESTTKAHGEKLDRLLHLIIATLIGVVGSLFSVLFKH